MLDHVKFTSSRDPARSRTAAMPASYAKLLLADRETKNAIAGMTSLFVAVLFVAHSSTPAPPSTPTPERAKPSLLSTTSSAATPAKRLPAPLQPPVTLGAVPHPPLLAPQLAPTRASPFFFKGGSNDRERALDCLAAAAWYEAGNDPEGQKSVIQVVLNRLRHPSFPSSVCGVVFQGSERTTGCQFTFTCDGSMQRRVPSARSWKSARALAEQALDGTVDTSVGQATHYHADYVAPWWSSALQKVSQIGAHIFYRWPGGRGHLVGNRHWATEADAVASAQARGQPSPASTADPNALVSTVAAPAAAQVNPATSRAHLISVDPQSPSGRWAVAALDQCTGQPACSVIAYGQANQLEKNRLRDPAAMERPLFVFVRDSASGMDLALWDCDRVPRPRESQCLPADRKALTSLMRSR